MLHSLLAAEALIDGCQRLSETPFARFKKEPVRQGDFRRRVALPDPLPNLIRSGRAYASEKRTQTVRADAFKEHRKNVRNYDRVMFG
jgi:hypothetical protein